MKKCQSRCLLQEVELAHVVPERVAKPLDQPVDRQPPREALLGGELLDDHGMLARDVPLFFGIGFEIEQLPRIFGILFIKSHRRMAIWTPDRARNYLQVSNYHNSNVLLISCERVTSAGLVFVLQRVSNRFGTNTWHCL